VADLPAIRARLAVLTEGYVPASLYREDAGALLAELNADRAALAQARSDLGAIAAALSGSPSEHGTRVAHGIATVGVKSLAALAAAQGGDRG
jgi:hypothetical protein